MNLLTRRAFLALFAAAIAGAGYVLYPTDDGKQASGNVIRIGAILPLTGKTAFLGEEEKKGLEAAKKMLATRGHNIEILYEDSKNEAKFGISAYLKLSSVNDVKGIIIAHSGVNGPISEYIASDANARNSGPIPVGTIVASTKITSNNDVYIRCYPSGRDEGRVMARHARESMGITTAAILYQNDDYGVDGDSEFSLAFSAAGGKIVFSDAFGKDESDHRPLLSKAIADSPEAIYVVGNTPSFSGVIRQLREIGYNGKILSGSAMEVGKLREVMGDDAVTDITYTGTFSPVASLTKTQEYRKFASALSDLGTKPSMLSVYPAVSLQVLVSILTQSGNGNVQQIVAKVTRQKFSTLLGSIQFNKKRDAILPIFIKRSRSIAPAQDEILGVVQSSSSGS